MNLFSDANSLRKTRWSPTAVENRGAVLPIRALRLAHQHLFPVERERYSEVTLNNGAVPDVPFRWSELLQGARHGDSSQKHEDPKDPFRYNLGTYGVSILGKQVR